MSDNDWADYDSVQMFPGCDCGHSATEHRYAWHDDRPDGCQVDGCPCEIGWEHT